MSSQPTAPNNPIAVPVTIARCGVGSLSARLSTALAITEDAYIEAKHRCGS